MTEPTTPVVSAARREQVAEHLSRYFEDYDEWPAQDREDVAGEIIAALLPDADQFAGGEGLAQRGLAHGGEAGGQVLVRDAGAGRDRRKAELAGGGGHAALLAAGGGRGGRFDVSLATNLVACGHVQ